MKKKLTFQDLLGMYKDEDLPEYAGIDLNDISRRGNFGNTPLHIACVRGNLDEVETLLNAGAEVNTYGELGNTPLHEAVVQSHKEVVKRLLLSGADPNLANENGETAGDIAVLMGDDEIIKLLTGGSGYR